MWSRIHLIPVLQAEEDRDQVRRMLADKARERELLGAETKVYHGDRYVSSVLEDLSAMDYETIHNESLVLTILQLREADVCCYPGKYYKIDGVRI